LNQILDEVIQDKDFESARYCLILSQTYHYIEDNKKISLQQKLENHYLFHTIDFWESFIACKYGKSHPLDSIYEEIEKQNKMMGTNESDSEKNQRIINTVFSQLYPICDNMLTFLLEKEKIKELISGFSKQYGLGKELDDHLIKIIDDCNYEGCVDDGLVKKASKSSTKSLERLFVKKVSHRLSEDTKPFEIEDITNQNNIQVESVDLGDFGFSKDGGYVMIESYYKTNSSEKIDDTGKMEQDNEVPDSKVGEDNEVIDNIKNDEYDGNNENIENNGVIENNENNENDENSKNDQYKIEEVDDTNPRDDV
jgi:hypothetical protein